MLSSFHRLLNIQFQYMTFENQDHVTCSSSYYKSQLFSLHILMPFSCNMMLHSSFDQPKPNLPIMIKLIMHRVYMGSTG